MADNKQNSETEKMNTGNKSSVGGGGGAASTGSATEKTSAPNSGENKQNSSSTSGNAESLKETLSQAKETAGQTATQVVGQAKDKAASVMGEQKTNLASGINTVADSIRQIGENLRSGDAENNQIAALAGKYGDTLAVQVEKLSQYVENRDFRELARDAEKFARKNPALFVGGAFTLGILAARFLKSSGSNQNSRNNRTLGSNGGSSKVNAAVQAS